MSNKELQRMNKNERTINNGARTNEKDTTKKKLPERQKTKY